MANACICGSSLEISISGFSELCNFSFMVFLASLKQCVELSFRRFLIVLIHKQLYNFQFFGRRANKKARALPYKIV